ncbi:hypothetical protein KH5_09450 [Urechidicola sp. KH5]
MKKILILFAFVIIIIGCNQPVNNTANTNLIDNYVQAVEGMDYEKMASFLADDYMGYGPRIDDSINKSDALISWKFNSQNIYESINYEKSRSVGITVPNGENQGDWVSNWAQLNIVFKNDKSEVTVWANTIYQIEDGKISKSYTFYNEADILQQLGYSFN